jgi:hypothetical protein
MKLAWTWTLTLTGQDRVWWVSERVSECPVKAQGRDYYRAGVQGTGDDLQGLDGGTTGVRLTSLLR